MKTTLVLTMFDVHELGNNTGIGINLIQVLTQFMGLI